MRLETEDTQSIHRHTRIGRDIGAGAHRDQTDLEILRADQLRPDLYLDHLGVRLGNALTELQRTKLTMTAHAEAEMTAKEEAQRLAAELRQRDTTIATLRDALEQRENEISLVQSKLAESATSPAPNTTPVSIISSRENTALLRRVRSAEEDSALQKAVMNLVQETLQVMASPGKWWNMLLPAFFVRRLKYDRLRKKGLFDARLYLKRYPDVVRAGSDPLHHYVTHGLSEGRTRT